MTPAALIEIAEGDPLRLAELGAERYARDVRDYRCLMIKQERIKEQLTTVQEVECLYREQPHSVLMRWRKNEDQVRRALFVDRPDFMNRNGEKLARVEPAGALVRLIVKDVMIPIRGERARQTSRRFIDEFGFKSTFAFFRHYNDLARERGVLKVRYGGEGQVDGRPTFIVIRDLPYSPAGPFAEARLIMHLDQELLLPVSVTTYADLECKKLLASYQFTQVRLNLGLTDADFRF